MRTIRFPIFLFLLVLGLFYASAFPTDAAEAPKSPEAKQYGKPGPDKILISIKGMVARPGRYYVKLGTTLAALPKLAGGLLACKECGRLPTAITLNEDDENYYQVVEIDILRTVKLTDGDRVRYWHYRI